MIDVTKLTENSTVTIVKFEDGHTEPFETVQLVYKDGALVVADVTRHYESPSIPESSRATIGETP